MVSVVQDVEREKHVYLAVKPQRLTVGDMRSSSGAQLLGVEPSGTLDAL